MMETRAKLKLIDFINKKLSHRLKASGITISGAHYITDIFTIFWQLSFSRDIYTELLKELHLLLTDEERQYILGKLVNSDNAHKRIKSIRILSLSREEIMIMDIIE